MQLCIRVGIVAFSLPCYKTILTDIQAVTSPHRGCAAIPILHKTFILWNTSFNAFPERVCIQKSQWTQLKNCIHQLPGVRLFGLIDNVIRSSVFHYLTFIKNQHFVTEHLHQCQIMTDKNEREAMLFF